MSVERSKAARAGWKVGRLVARLFTLLWLSAVYILLLAPLVVIVGASFDGRDQRAFINFPPENISLLWYGRIPAEYLHAIGISVALATATSVLACLIGVPAAFGLVRGRVPGKALLATLFRAPLQIPSIVVGLAFLQFYVLIDDAMGFYATGTFFGIAMAHTFIAVPLVISSVGAILQRFDRRLEEAAASLGSPPRSVFRRVTLPIIMPGVYAGALFAFMVSFGDVAIALFLGGSSYLTYPVEIFNAREFDFDPTILSSASLVILGLLVLIVLIQRFVGLGALLQAEQRN